MFRGLLSQKGRTPLRRAARRLAVVQERCSGRYAPPRTTVARRNESLHHRHRTAQDARLDYSEHLDHQTGDSVVQQHFNGLVWAALLRYGPALPVEVTENFSSRHSDSPASRCSVLLACDVPPHIREKAQASASEMFVDEVGLKTHELLTLLRREKPEFSIQEHGGGVPFSLLIRNCSYLRAYGGRVHYMRLLRNVSLEKGSGGRYSEVPPDEKKKKEEFILFTLGLYKFREPPPQDGIRCGPQPWLYSSRLV